MNEANIYQWTTDDGLIIEGATTPFATINQAGDYQLTVRDTTNQCESMASISIMENITLPTVNPPEALAFDCTNERLPISLSTAEELSFLTFNWRAANGAILSDTTSINIEVGLLAPIFLKLRILEMVVAKSILLLYWITEYYRP